MRASTRTLLREGDGSTVRRTVLPGGLRIITEQVPGVRSVAFGIWVAVGSRDETAAQMGSAHYLEHLLFKGTKRRSALDISASIEAVGGDLNAFTTKEYTCYYARVLDVDLPLAIEVVSDVVHDEFASVLFGGSPLGRPVLGTIETIEAISRNAINRFYRGRYQPQSMVIAAAGNLDHEVVVKLVKSAFGEYLDAMADVEPARKRGKKRNHGNGVKVTNRPTEQAHLVLGVPGLARSDDRRYALAVLTTAFGGGMSSRLFQEIREKRGLAYSVYAFSQGFADDGMLGIYVGCLPNKVATVLEVCNAQIRELVAGGLSKDEIDRGKGQVRGSTVLGQEDTGARMTRIARSELHDEPLLSIDQLLAKVNAVTQEEINEVATDLFSEPLRLAVIGPFADESVFTG